MSALELTLLLLVVAVALGLLAKRITTPLPILLVLGGLALGVAGRFVPGLPVVALTPDLVFLVFLPPLLFDAAYDTSLGSVRRNAAPIALLAVGLVLATMTAVALALHAAIPAVPVAAAFVLGAIVSPPDPVAATAVASQVGMPTRLATILEGEGLINDVTALTAFQIAVAVVVSGRFSAADAALTFLRMGLVGTAVGLAVGWLTTAVLAHVDDAVLETVITLLMPYTTYLAGERLGGSAVLATVVGGLVVRHRITRVARASTRLSGRAVWKTLVFVVDGLVFILIGFQLGDIASRGLPPGVVRGMVLVSAVAIVVRLAWMFTVPHAVRLARAGFGARTGDARPSWRELAVLGWAGMRGVVSIAAVLSLPLRDDAGRGFPARGYFVLVTFGFVFVTLVLQGLTLPALIRRLGVSDPDAAGREERMARARAGRAGLAEIDTVARAGILPTSALERLREIYLWSGEADEGDTESAVFRAVGHQALEAEREVVRALRDREEIGGDPASTLEEEIDLRDVQLGDALPHERAEDVPS